MKTYVFGTSATKQRIEIETSVGRLVPSYSFADAGRKKEAGAGYFPTGELRSVPLEEATYINTPIGEVSSELVTFYKSGKLKRVFPLNGRITAYWTEADEYGLAETLEIETPAGTVNVKPIYIQFYETGELQSIAFWPGENVEFTTPAGTIMLRKGIAFHKNGNIAACEPSEETAIDTPVGRIYVYDPAPEGISAESGALSFSESGSVTGLLTVRNCIVVNKGAPEEVTYSPSTIYSYCDDSVYSLEPLEIKFTKDAVVCTNKAGSFILPVDLNNISVRNFITEKNIAGMLCHA